MFANRLLSLLFPFENCSCVSERRRTFDELPIDYISKCVLAETGMHYSRESDKVKCYFCEVEIGRWNVCDDLFIKHVELSPNCPSRRLINMPLCYYFSGLGLGLGQLSTAYHKRSISSSSVSVSEHTKCSPNCPLMLRRMTRNVPINADALESILPPTSASGSNVGIELGPTANPESSISSTSVSTSSPNVSSNFQMEYPEYAIEAARCRTFAELPRTMKRKPQELAEAGFFYTGTGDCVNCFGLNDWDENDEPWERHALQLGECRFVKLMKGQAYIDAMIAKYNLAAEKTQEALSAASDVGEVQECGIQTEGQQQHNCLTVAAIQTSKIAAATTKTLAADSLQRSDSNSSTEKGTIPEEKLCKICYAAEYNTAFLPCGHVVACAKCASSVTKCPVCKESRDVMRIYLA